MTLVLPTSYHVRPPTLEDIPAIYSLLAACDIADFGEVDSTEAELRAEWQSPGFDLTRDAWEVALPDGSIIAHADIYDTRHGPLYASIFVHPDQRGHGIGAYLLRRVEERARECIATAPEGTLVTVNFGMNHYNEASRRFAERAGYSLIRSYWRMAIDLDAARSLPEQRWPDGIVLRTFIRGQDEHAVYSAVEDAFADHWGHVPQPYDEWLQLMDRPDFDPSLWFMAMDGDQIAGVAQCRVRLDNGWVGRLSVRRPYRQRGLGTALLLHVFREFQRRGYRSVALGVDSQNLTGATRLYEQVGMRVTRQFDSYRKVLRPGEDLAVQSLLA